MSAPRKTRSEFLRRAAALPLLRAGFENDFVALCEEFGASFEPEEKPLPERLEFRVGHGWLADGKTIANWPIELKERLLAEAARRYSLQPELRVRALAARNHGCVETGEAILAILDGTEEPTS